MGACLSVPVQDDGSRAVVLKKEGQAMHVSETSISQSSSGKGNKCSEENLLNKKKMEKRIAVAAEAISCGSNIEITNVPKTSLARGLIEKAMEGNILFEDLSLGARHVIVNSMSAKIVKAGDEIIVQGDTEASTYYAIERGEFAVTISDEANTKNSKLVAKLGPGEGFGELALLYSSPRAATVTTVSSGKLWVMERRIYHAIKQSFWESLAIQRQQTMELVPMLSMLSPQHKSTVSEALNFVEYKAGEVICREGDIGDNFFVVQEGTVLVSIGGEVKSSLNAGEYFGERALLKCEPRAATVIADGYVACFSLNADIFNETLGPIENLWRFETLRRVPVLATLSEKQLNELAGCMEPLEYRAAETVFLEGELGRSFYVVEEGEFIISNNSNKELAKCHKGHCFGELALLHDQPRAATVTASIDSRVLFCSKESFERHLGSLSEIRNLWRFETLRKVPLFSDLTQEQKLALANAFETVTFASHEIVVKKGESGDTFYILEKGECIAIDDNGKELCCLGPGAYFGERALIKREPRAATVRTSTDSCLLSLSHANFEKLLGPILHLLQQKAAAYDATLRAERIQDPIGLTDLNKIAVLGSGAFGNVSLVEYKNRHYALKTLSKGHIVKSCLSSHVKREKNIQMELSSPFLVSLQSSFQDSAHLYLVLEFVQGGDFFSYLRSRNKTIPEHEAKFYAACVILGLEYMHDREVAWRDLKPENLLIDSAGYLKLTDFGFAKRIPRSSRSYTLCGTPEYLAPEIVNQSGHGTAVDWWAIGVFIFEMVAGFPPFHNDDRITMFRSICSAQYKVPDYFSPELKDIVSKFLTRSPAQRLGGSHNSIVEIKRHPWFADFDWDGLMQRTLRAPFVPNIVLPRGRSIVPQTTNSAVAIKGEKSKAATPNNRYESTGLFEDF